MTYIVFLPRTLVLHQQRVEQAAVLQW